MLLPLFAILKAPINKTLDLLYSYYIFKLLKIPQKIL